MSRVLPRYKGPLEVEIGIRYIIEWKEVSLKLTDLSSEELNLIDDALTLLEDIEADNIDHLVEKDQTADTVEEFLDCVSTSQETIERIKALRERLMPHV